MAGFKKNKKAHTGSPVSENVEVTEVSENSMDSGQESKQTKQSGKKKEKYKKTGKTGKKIGVAAEERNIKIRRHMTTILLVFVLVIGVGIMMYPTISNWWNSLHSSRAIASYQAAVEDMSAEDKEAEILKAREYNARLAMMPMHFTLSDSEMVTYTSLLNVGGNGIMGYITIPKIDVELPIYHTTSESVLQIAVGHIEGSSLPVGGPSTHAILSGHRGLVSARLFTDLDELSEGDEFTITVLGEKYEYQVDQIRIVLPQETSDLAISQGEDYVTLVTCTPYGVNTHRMLVRGRRVEESAVQVTPDGRVLPVIIVAPAVGIPILLVILILAVIRNKRRRPDRDARELLEDLNKSIADNKIKMDHVSAETYERFEQKERAKAEKTAELESLKAERAVGQKAKKAQKRPSRDKKRKETGIDPDKK